MSVKPLGDRVLVKSVDAAEKTQGGIFIPQTAQEKTQEAEVVAVGPGKEDKDGKTIKIALKAGDRVIHDKYAGTTIKVGGVEHILIKVEDILAVVE